MFQSSEEIQALAEATVLNQQGLTLVTPATDLSANGLKVVDTVGEGVAFGNAVYKAADGKWYKTNAAVGSLLGPCTAVVAAAAGILVDESGLLLIAGLARDDSWAWTPGGVLYRGETPGEITQVKPSDPGDVVQMLGFAFTADVICFTPSPNEGTV